jgi:PAS domain S-box-containing protein
VPRRELEPSAWHRLAVEQAAVGIVQLGADGAFLEVNPGFCRMLRYDAGELRGLPLEKLLHPDEVESYRDWAARALAGEIDAYFLEQRALRKDGSTVWLDFTHSVSRDASGRLAFSVAVVQDVSARRSAERALQRRAIDFFAAFDVALAPLAQTDPHTGRFLRVNARFCELTGYAEGDLLEMTLEQLTHPEDRTAGTDLLSGLGPERRYLRKDGSTLWALVYASPMRQDSGEIFRTLSSWVDVSDRKQAELAVAQSEERFRLASEAVDGLIYDVDLESGRVYRSPGISRALGFAAEEFLPTTDAWEAQVHPEDREDARARVAAAMQAGLDALTLEYRVRHKAGHWIDLWDNRRILRDGNGKPVRIVGHAIDVTPRKRAEEALRASEARLAALANATPAMVWTTDPSGVGLSASEAWQRYTGLSVSAGGGWFGLLHRDDAARTADAWQRALAEQRDFEIENRIRRHDGEYRWYLTRAVPLRDEGGMVTGWMGASIDIHELKTAQAALEESEERFRILADGAPVLIWVNGLEGCEFVNLAYKEFLGVGDIEVRGLDWVRFVHREDRETYLAAYAGASERRSPFQAEFRFRRHDGEYRWMLSAGSPRLGPTGELLGYVGSTLDITDRKLAESALHEADRRKDEFLATLAHELRNPLAPIRNAVEVLRFERVSHPRVEWARDLIDRQVDQLARLVEDLLDVSRITRGTLELRMEPIALAELVHEVVETSRPLLAKHQARIEVSLPEEPIALRGDRVRLAQVLANLIDNAAKHSSGGAPIELAAERDAAELRLRVRDRGTGMTPDELARVFEMFYQAGDRSQRKPGLGVGLALVRSLVELHGGTVDAHSDGLGQGSTFLVRLPLREAPGPRARRRDDEPRSAQRRRVLVVDDNRDSATSLAALVELLGHRVETAADGIEAIEVAERFLPQVILLDLGLPRLDGYAAARRIRSAPWGAGMLLVAQTGWGQQADRALATEAGFDHHLVKPVALGALRAILAGAPDHRDE